MDPHMSWIILLLVVSAISYLWTQRPRYTWEYQEGTRYDYILYRNGQPNRNIKSEFGIIPFDTDTGREFFDTEFPFYRWVRDITSDARRRHILKRR